ncbi:MAG: hypothetical protein J7L53_10150 [Deltaproteobacteria bacterium]|nr:hypothetical protein [Deltaproteobacteria bacterium]
MERDNWNTWPSTGNAIKVNWPYEELRDLLWKFKSDHVYYYVVNTVECNEETGKQMYNTGSAPNFQGGIITLCTCKHAMRATGDFHNNVWVAGLTGLEVARRSGTKDNNLLFYLGKVKHAFQHYGELIEYMKRERPGAIDAKNASYNIRGDLYIPKPAVKDYFDPRQYDSPHKNHVHKDNWQNDINYIYRNNLNKHAKYLLSDEEYSFAWSKKLVQMNRGFVFSSGKKAAITAGCKRVSLQNFLEALEGA